MGYFLDQEDVEIDCYRKGRPKVLVPNATVKIFDKRTQVLYRSYTVVLVVLPEWPLWAVYRLLNFL